jgi:hypothetical protein
MVCYRDMTFCPFYKECNKGNECDIAYTDEVKAGANKWWGEDNAPVALHRAEPVCFYPKT